MPAMPLTFDSDDAPEEKADACRRWLDELPLDTRFRQKELADARDSVAYELDAIAAVVIGGTALTGGKGNILGTVVGALIIGVLTNILRLRLIDTHVEFMIKAVIIVAAVWLQSARKPK